MAKKSRSSNSSKKKGNMTLAIVALILNVLILPCLGTLIGGKTKAGIWQLVLTLVGFPLTLILIGFPMMLAAWIWGIFSGVQLIQEAQ